MRSAYMVEMTYVTQRAARAQLQDPRSRYRRRPQRRAPSAERPSAPAARSSTEPERPPHVEAAAQRWQRITELNARLSATLDGEGRALWLALEEALHVHWLDVAVDHYNRGFEAGRAQAWLERSLAGQDSPLEKLRALAAGLQQVLEQLERH